MKCSSYHIISEGTWCQYNLPLVITLITWVRWYLSGFSTVKFLFFPFCSLFFGSKSQKPYYFKRRVFTRSLLERRVTYIIWNFSVGRLVQSPTFVYLLAYLFNHLLISMWTFINIYFIFWVVWCYDILNIKFIDSCLDYILNWM